MALVVYLKGIKHPRAAGLVFWCVFLVNLEIDLQKET